MKINGTNINSYHPYTSDLPKVSLQPSAKPKKAVQSFDQITLTGNSSNRHTEEVFTAELKNKISQEVRRPASAQDLEDLKTQIKNGTYQLDLETVAKKMLLL